MKKTASVLVIAILASLASHASADPGKKEGHGRGHQYKEEYWEGDCKVKRKVNKHGDVKEERKCKAPPPDRYQAYDTVVEERVVYPVREAPPPREPGVSINVHLGR